MTEAATPSSDPPAEPPRSAASLRQDVISGYMLAAARVGAWAGVTAYIYREIGVYEFGLFTLMRSFLTLANYPSLGLVTALVHELSRAIATDRRKAVAAIPVLQTPVPIDSGDAPPLQLNYATNRTDQPSPTRISRRPTEEERVQAAGRWIKSCIIVAVIGLTLAVMFAITDWRGRSEATDYFHGIFVTAGLLGLAMAFRIASDDDSATLHARGYLGVDQSLAAATEIAWVVIVYCTTPSSIMMVALCWAACNLGLIPARRMALQWLAPELRPQPLDDVPRVRPIAVAAGLITLGNCADFLYGPSALLIVGGLLGADQVARYAAILQIDAALLLVVAGIAGAVFPRAAKASAAGDLRSLRRLYLRGTLASAALLGVAAIVTIVFSDRLFRLWLGQAPPDALAILPLVLIHTVVGGSSGVGRAVLLGMGKVRPFVTASLIAGFGNVILGAIFAGPVGLGLKGIVIATIAVVVARCAIWMPWYVLRLTKDAP